MAKKENKVTEQVLLRLSSYLSALDQVQQEGKHVVSSMDMSKFTGYSAALIRRDLSYFGEFGVPGKGYYLASLKSQICGILNLNSQHRVLLAGAGNLGSALTGYEGLRKKGFHIVGLFDNDPLKVGRQIWNTEVYPINEMEEQNKELKAEMGIITVPAAASQEVADRMVDAGLRCILNFAPTAVQVPEHIKVRNVDLAKQLEFLAYFLSLKE